MLRRRGLTLIEIIATVALIGILIALILPAVQAARERARHLQCSNNLKQIGIALQNYLGIHGVFPQSNRWISPQTLLLPYLQQTVLYNAINMDVNDPSARFENATVHRATVSVFVCPSDTTHPDGVSGTTNYAANYGFEMNLQGTSENAPFTEKVVTLADVTDGTSTTVGVAEWCIGPLFPGRHAKGTQFALKLDIGYRDITTFAEACHRLNFRTAIPGGSKGGTWLVSTAGGTLYNHALPPGDYSCVNSNWYGGAWTAGSQHGGGANTLFLDGHVTFVKEAINLKGWRALGTMKGGEIPPEE